MNGMKKLSEFLLFVATGSLAHACVSGAQTRAAQTPAQSIDTPKSNQTVPQDSALSDARRLSQQGKFDEALAKLEALAEKDPELSGLAHELGVTYYKKSDYLKATASFKKALKENPVDDEAIQLMGLSYY